MSKSQNAFQLLQLLFPAAQLLCDEDLHELSSRIFKLYIKIHDLERIRFEKQCGNKLDWIQEDKTTIQ